MSMLNAPRTGETRGPVGLDLRLIAAKRLGEVLAGDRFVPLGAAEIVEPRDRALANRLVTTALRRHGHLSLALKRLLERGLPARAGSFEAVLRLALTQLLYLPEMGDHSALFLAVEAVKRDRRARHLAKLMNAVLRRAQAEAETLRQMPMAALFPAALAERWREIYGAEALDRFGMALLEGAPLDLTLKDAATDGLPGALPVFADVLRLDHRDRRVEELPGFAEGRWWVQDLAASLPARLLELPPGAAVADLCAAPGGKTAQLVKAGYRVTAVENDGTRLARLGSNLDRLGYRAELVEADARNFTPPALFDGVLLDAPCSATGTFRRHPEVIWHRTAADIGGRVALQRELLAAASRLLRPGGMLVYCVCSLEPEEGEAQARWAIENLPGIAPVPVSAAELAPLTGAATPAGYLRTHPAMTVPGAGGTLDGFFAARFRRG
jgi:16S rRNA (cytosine967-C5)-methyltransferase